MILGTAFTAFTEGVEKVSLFRNHLNTKGSHFQVYSKLEPVRLHDLSKWKTSALTAFTRLLHDLTTVETSRVAVG